MSLFKKRSKPDRPKVEETGERRQLTVLFYDIVGATSLGQARDPEALRALFDQVHTGARAVLEQAGGTLQQVMGDGGMAYFGYPVAMEDAALAAVEAAHALIAMREEIDGAPPLRIGIATSVVVVPDQAEAQDPGRLKAVGVAPNLAARLESVADPDSVLVSPATYALTWRAAEYEPVDDLTLKGFPDITRAWRPVALHPADTRFRQSRDAATAVQGRNIKVATLTDAWDRTLATGGTAFLIEGEPGIGKSRIAAELQAQTGDARKIVLQCQPRTEGEALFAIIQMYDRAYETGTDAALSAAAEQTAEKVGALEEDDTLSPQDRRAAVLDAVTDILEDLARKAPLLIVVEDVHWIDEVTLAVLHTLATRAPYHPMLLLITARPDAALDDLRDVVQPLTMEPLAPEDARSLIAVSAPVQLSDVTRDWIVDRADGNPLFLIELTAHACDVALEAGALSDISGADVGSLRDLLATRLETAGQSKRTAQIASILGREYPYHLLARLADGAGAQTLDADLQRLVDHGLHDVIGNGYAYGFRHALIRDVAYDSQLRAVRRSLHGKVVDMVDADPALAEDVPDILLAEHCVLAERTARGAALFLDVAEEAIRRSALRAPRTMLDRVLRLADALDPGTQRDLIRLRAIALLGPLVTLLNGHSAAAPLYETGQEIYFDLPEAERAPFFPVLWGWWFTSGDLVEQTRRSEVLIRDVSPTADAESRLQALHCGWATLFDGGAHDRCLHAIEDGLALYDEDAARKSMYLYGHDARVCGLGERALCGWLTGKLDTSRAAIAECEAWADATGHAGSRLHALDIATQVAVFNEDLGEINRILTKVSGITEAEAAPVIAAKRQIFQGWMRARQGAPTDYEKVRRALADLRRFGVVEDTPFYADIAAELAMRHGHTDDALGPLEQEIAEAQRTGLTYWLPELLRRRATMVIRSAAQEALEEGFHMAQAQGAQMLALRNVATWGDLGFDLPEEIARIMRDRIDDISDTALRRKVMDALAP